MNMKQQSVHKRIIEEIMTWISVKLIAILPNAQFLINLSAHLTNTLAPLELPVLERAIQRPCADLYTC
jgi:hypothetical protein